MKKYISLNFYFLLFIFIPSFLYSQITFDANFESGNIASVSTNDSVHFNVTTREDIGGRWFYFRMSGVNNKFVSVTVQNSDVTRAMYSYDNNTFLRFSESESPQVNTFEKTYENDTVYVAYYTPYTFSYLQKRLNEWTQNDFVTLDTLGFTPMNLPIQQMKITDPAFPDSTKKIVWIHARTHPGETPSSWHFDGIVQELLSGKEVINYYLSKIVFYLVPFVNPDGVYYGRSRTNFNGIDLESNWNKTESETAKEVKILRQRLTEINNRKVISNFLNLHSQASSYCTFWIHTPESTSDSFYYKEYEFANLNASDNPYFEQDDFNESSLKSKFPEGWLWNNYGDKVMALTYETPYNNYLKSSNTLEVTNDNLFEIGKRTVYSIAEYLNISHPKRLIIDNNVAIVNGNVNIKFSGKEFYGSNFYELPENDTSAFVLYNVDSLVFSSSYSLFGWWQSDPANSFETKIIVKTKKDSQIFTKTQRLNGGQWNFLGEVFLGNDFNSLSIKVESNQTGKVVADAFRLIYNGPILSVKNKNLPTGFILYQNYPNPFNPTTTIKYTIANAKTLHSTSQRVQLKIYDVLGREVTTLVNKEQSPGIYQVQFDGSNLASGVYLYRLNVGNQSQTKRMLLIK